MPEERVREGNNRRQEVSIWNWIGTMLLLMIPAVLAAVAGFIWEINLVILIGAVLLADIVLMVVLMLTTRRASKRNALVASLILTVVFAVASVLACAFFGGEITSFIEKLNQPAAEAVDVLPQEPSDGEQQPAA